MAESSGVPKDLRPRRRRRDQDEGEDPSADRPPSRWADAALALLLAVVDIMALAGMALFMFLAGMSHSEPSSRPSTGHGVPLLVFALFWVVPGALGVSAFVQARLSMPISATVQGLFFVVGVVLGFGATRMLLSFA